MGPVRQMYLVANDKASDEVHAARHDDGARNHEPTRLRPLAPPESSDASAEHTGEKETNNGRVNHRRHATKDGEKAQPNSHYCYQREDVDNAKLPFVLAFAHPGILPDRLYGGSPTRKCGARTVTARIAKGGGGSIQCEFPSGEVCA